MNLKLALGAKEREDVFYNYSSGRWSLSSAQR
jgi:hypothetical protein